MLVGSSTYKARATRRAEREARRRLVGDGREPAGRSPRDGQLIGPARARRSSLIPHWLYVSRCGRSHWAGRARRRRAVFDHIHLGGRPSGRRRTPAESPRPLPDGPCIRNRPHRASACPEPGPITTSSRCKTGCETFLHGRTGLGAGTLGEHTASQPPGTRTAAKQCSTERPVRRRSGRSLADGHNPEAA